MRAVKGRPAPVLTTFVGEDGETPVVQAGAVTVTVTDGAGEQVTSGAAEHVGDGVYRFTIPARTQLDRLDVDFAGDDSQHVYVPVQIVAARLASVGQVRDAIGARDVLVGGSPLGAVVLAAALEAAEDWLDDALFYPAVRKGWRARWVEPYGGDRVHVPGVREPGEMYELTVGSTVIDVDDVYADGTGWARWTAGQWGPGKYDGWGTHGLLDPPAQLGRACAVLAGYLARASNVPERATMIMTEGSQIVLARPAVDRPTGLPEVDAVVAALSRRSPLGGW